MSACKKCSFLFSFIFGLGTSLAPPFSYIVLAVHIHLSCFSIFIIAIHVWLCCLSSGEIGLQTFAL